MPRSPTRSRRARSPFSSWGRSPAVSPARTEARFVRYMLLIYLDERALDDAERERCYRESAQLAHQLAAAGQYLAAAPLEPTATATSVRVRADEGFGADGPFAETKEQLGGYFLIDARDLDEAIAIAARIPMARRGTVEVRPVIEIAGLPQEK